MASATPPSRPPVQRRRPRSTQSRSRPWERIGSRPGGRRPRRSRPGGAQRRCGPRAARPWRFSGACRVGRGATSSCCWSRSACCRRSSGARDAIAIFATIALAALPKRSPRCGRSARRMRRDLERPNAFVRRAGTVAAIPVDALVIGDVPLVGQGGAGRRRPRHRGRRPGHGRVALTGEPVSAAKDPSRSPPALRSPSGPRCYAGSAVVSEPARVSWSQWARTPRSAARATCRGGQEPPTPPTTRDGRAGACALIVAVTACVVVPSSACPRPARTRDALGRLTSRLPRSLEELCRSSPYGAGGTHGLRLAQGVSFSGGCAPPRLSAR